LAGLATGDINILAAESANWDASEAYEITKQWLAEFDDIDLIISHGNTMTNGVVDALIEAGRTEISLAWYGANPDRVLQLQGENRFSMFVDEQTVLIGRSSLQALVRYLETGESYRRVYVPIRLVSDDTLEAWLDEQITEE